MIWHVLLIYIDQDKINSTNTVKLLSSIAAMQLNVFSRLEKFMGKKKKIYDQQLYFLTFNHPARKMSKYGVFSGLHLDTFHAVSLSISVKFLLMSFSNKN